MESFKQTSKVDVNKDKIRGSAVDGLGIKNTNNNVYILFNILVFIIFSVYSFIYLSAIFIEF